MNATRSSPACRLIAVVLACAAATAAQQPLLFTTELDGQFDARTARIAAAATDARAQEPQLLWLDAGNALGDAGTDAARLPQFAAVLGGLGHDAVNLSFRDLRGGHAATLAALRQAGVKFVSCTLADAASGSLLAPAFTVVERGGRKVAVVGATALPAGLEQLPHVQRQLAGVRLLPLADAVRTALAAARAAAPEVMLAFYGSAQDARDLRATFGSEVSAIVIGGAPAAWLAPNGEAAGGPARLLGAVRSGALHRARDGAAIEVELGATAPADARVEALVQALGAASPRADAAPAAQLVVGGTVALDAVGENRGMRLQVHSAALLERHGARVAANDRRLLVLDITLENIIPLTLVQERQIPTEYRLPKLGDHLYVVCGGSRLGRVAVTPNENETAIAAGHLPVVDLRLPRIGATRRGTAVFDVPAVTASELSEFDVQLRCYDYAHGHIALPLIGRARDPGQPLGPPQSNEVVELGVHRLERRDVHAGRKAPTGSKWVVVDVRARSTFVTDGDATAFDPQAKPGARVAIGNVADWTDAPRYLQLVVDGLYAGSAPVLDGEDGLGLAPRFLPDLPTGGVVAFLAPTSAASLELRCDFPNAKSSLDGKLLRPKGFTVALEGERPPVRELPALAQTKDSQFDVRITRRAPLTSGAEGHIAIDFEVVNVGKSGEFFQPRGQLQLATADGKLWPAVDADGVEHPAGETLWVPAGERRRGTLVFAPTGNATRLRIAYASVDAGGAKMLTLPENSAVVVAAEPAAPVSGAARPAAEPTPAPVAPPVTKPVAPPVKPAKPEPPALTAAILEPPQPPQGLAGVGLTAEQVNRAIDRGAEFLWTFVRNEATKRNVRFGGAEEHLLAALALVHSDAHKKHPDFDVALRNWLTQVDVTSRTLADPSVKTMYVCGLLVMLLDAYGDPAFAETRQMAVRAILETQGPNGTWTYERKLAPELIADGKDEPLRVTGGVPLDGVPPAPLARRSPWSEGVGGDNSVSQYAVLGLDAAVRSGQPIDQEAWRRAVTAFRDAQCDDGGWAYHGKSYAGYGSMTGAGICSLALGLHHLGQDPRQDPAIWRGVQWIDARFAVDRHPGRATPGEWLYYYLYSIERVGRVLGLDYIGRHEWYPMGAKFLLAQQRGDGGWQGVGSEDDVRLATSFALLFLTRATPPLVEQKLARGGKGTLRTGARVPPGGRYYVILDASGSMLEQREGVSKWQVARDAVGKLVADLPDQCELALRVYGHRKNALAPDASDDTELVLPMRALDKAKFATTLQALRARGKTPLAKSLQAAAKDLANATAQQPVTLVLLTDGGEDSMPRQDPVAAAAAFAKLSTAVRFHLIGFDIGRDDWTKQLQAMAVAGAGAYWTATRAEQLASTLRSTVLGVPEAFLVRDSGGKECGRGGFGAALELPEGRYVLSTTWAGRPCEIPFWINTDRSTGVTFDARALAGKK